MPLTRTGFTASTRPGGPHPEVDHGRRYQAATKYAERGFNIKMGSYGDLTLNGFEILSFKNGLPGLALEIFTESDRREYERQRHYWEPEDGEEYRLEWAIEYSCSAGQARDRLECRGYSRNRAEAAFDAGMQDLVESERGPFWKHDSNGSFEFDAKAAQEFKSEFTFRELISLLRRIVKGAVNCGRPHLGKRDRRSAKVQYVTDYLESFWGFRKVDPIHALRALIEACPTGTFTLNLTELASNGWIPDDSPLCSSAPQFTILTEGKSDGRLLEAALNARRPHIAPYFSFLDFNLVNLGGGAGQLVTIIKALVAARLAQRFVAIFDNDSAAKDALRSINMDLPENIRVLKLPQLPLAKKYPTVGPQGTSPSDVNGRAVSLEMFLGQNNLRDSSGQLRPVVWTSYVPGVLDYQGEIKDKVAIQTAFLEAIANPDLFTAQDWSSMDILLDSLCTVFADSAATGYDPYTD